MGGGYSEGMPTFKTWVGLSGGIVLSLLAALAAIQCTGLGWNYALQMSPLTLAIVAGMVLGNATPSRFTNTMQPGLRFSQQKILRLGIVLYGIRLTMQDLFRLGPQALVLDVTVIGCVVIGGFWLGTRVFRLDPDTALLISVGSGICGAAAVLATEGVIESESHKASIAVATVVTFGTAAMFLYPLLYPLTGFTERQFGIYTGATVHEVAQVVAAARAVGQMASDTAVITKMLRVLLLAPVLLLVGRIRRKRVGESSRQISFPWFVLWFGAVIAGQSLYSPPPRVRSTLVNLDTVLLASAMFALGMGTRWSQLSRAGLRPLLLAALLFGGLVSGGFLLTRLLVT